MLAAARRAADVGAGTSPGVGACRLRVHPRRPVAPPPARSIGRNIKQLIDRKDDRHCFRMHKDRVYYVSERMMRLATSIPRRELLALGTCFGKFTKSGRFMLKVTCLDYLAQFAKYKVWVKPTSEMSFLYGNNILKSGVQRMTEGIPQYAGVVVYSGATEGPLGFGIAAHSSDRAKDMDPTQIAVLHQADVGEYLRVEEEL